MWSIRFRTYRTVSAWLSQYSVTKTTNLLLKHNKLEYQYINKSLIRSRQIHNKLFKFKTRRDLASFKWPLQKLNQYGLSWRPPNLSQFHGTDNLKRCCEPSNIIFHTYVNNNLGQLWLSKFSISTNYQTLKDVMNILIVQVMRVKSAGIQNLYVKPSKRFASDQKTWSKGNLKEKYGCLVSFIIKIS